MKRKVVSALLTSAMVMSLAACGSSDSQTGTGTDAAENQTTGSTESGSTQAQSTERQTLTWSVIDVNAGVNATGDYAEEIMNQLEEFCGADLELIWYANDALSEKNSLALTSPSTMPQIMSWGGTVTGDVVSAAKNGAFVDLNNYIWDSEKYPYLSQLSEDVAANLTVNGQLIALPRTRVVGRYGLSYRQDWAEKLGVELPENATPDDVYNMLYAFTYNDPDGNGVDDTIGMEMTSYTGPFDIIQTWFGCGNGWQEVDGQLVPVWTTDEYFEAVDYIKKLYDDGLMPADFYSRPTDSWSNGCKTGENGVFIDVLDSGKRIWQYYEAEDTLTPSVVNPDEPASMTLYGAVNGHTLATAGYNGFFTLSATTLDTPEKIEAALTVLDRLCSPEMLTLTQYGLEGINYQYDADGYIEDLDADAENTEAVALANNYKGLNQLLTFLPTSESSTGAIPVKSDKFSDAQNAAYAEALEYAEVNPALSYLVGSDTYSQVGADLDDQVTAARTQYICGSITLDEFKATLDSIRGQGYDAIIEEVNAQR
ncbi:MAG: ABC transporter substrate-binding protein [Butyrivibrio sp.]|uniref:ABC transporter substrate-binding protein n=1 Tax=Butyrivibrio sp. TaxID=28121 RepID=UPI0025CD6A3D|nr:ABC transporter substrate-binding protein [Butyrivibrio sp.]MCR5772470.1 ABC transporter substrate-binding protein [Butyrivibrio sp.]